MRLPGGWRTSTARMADRLAAVGLIAPRQAATVGGMLDAFLAANPHAKPATRVVWGQQTVVCGNTSARIGPCGASAGRRRRASGNGWSAEKLAAATVARGCSWPGRFFAYAVRCEWIDRNPFAGVSHTARRPAATAALRHGGRKRKRLIDAAPNWVWRTIIALARFGGLRTPSETLSLRLADLDWEHGAMTVTSPKTEGHGQGQRVVPMFARLRPYLDEAWDMAREGQTHVIPENLYLPAAHGPRGWVNCNLRTTFEKIVRRAGLEPWPRLFHALRASCESDLAREYPITTVCRWIGNTVAIAARHYVQVTDEDFRRASGHGQGAAQNPAQQPSETARKGSARKHKHPSIFRRIPRGASVCKRPGGAWGFEPQTSSLSGTRS